MLITGKGHANITAAHSTTIAFTKDPEITLRGDCFIAVACDWELGPDFLEKLRQSKKVVITIECGNEKDTVTATGHSELVLSDNDLVIRKSAWVDSRTLAINADKAAKDLSLTLVESLKQGKAVRINVDV
jgi:hypothetical protein